MFSIYVRVDNGLVLLWVVMEKVECVLGGKLWVDRCGLWELICGLNWIEWSVEIVGLHHKSNFNMKSEEMKLQKWNSFPADDMGFLLAFLSLPPYLPKRAHTPKYGGRKAPPINDS